HKTIRSVFFSYHYLPFLYLFADSLAVKKTPTVIKHTLLGHANLHANFPHIFFCRVKRQISEMHAASSSGSAHGYIETILFHQSKINKSLHNK
ncbi:hypothetical protein ACJX0J_038860, partial [Zea mays]